LDILLCGNEKIYWFNEEAFELMEMFNVSKIWIERLSSLKGKIYNKEEMDSVPRSSDGRKMKNH
jgi:hypothetical protein